MSAINTVNHYLVRYRNLSGETHEDCVYASDAMEARDLACEFHAELSSQLFAFLSTTGSCQKSPAACQDFRQLPG